MEDTQQTTTEETIIDTPEAVVENVETVAETAVEQTVVEQPVEPPPTDPFASLTPELVAQRFAKDEQQKTALLKAFGLDDFILGAHDYYRKTGNLAEYAEVKSVDYNKMPDEKIVERKLREQYASAGLSDDELQLLIEDEMQNRFKLDAEVHSERDVLISKAKMKAEAAEFRKTLIDRQQQFKAPERVVEATPEVNPEQQVAQVRSQILGDAGVQQFMQVKKLQMGDAQNPYNYEVTNPQDTIAILYDWQQYSAHMAQKDAAGQVVLNADGTPKLDYGKMLKLAAYAQDMNGIEKKLIDHGETLRRKKEVDEAENVKLDKSEGTQAEPDDMYKALHRKLMGQ